MGSDDAARDDLRGILDGLPDAVGVLQGRVALYANRALMEAASVRTLDDLNAVALDDVMARANLRELQAVIHGASDGPLEVRLSMPGQPAATWRVQAWDVRWDGEPARCLVARDLTRAKSIEAGLAHADRLASIGSLAAGVAHEINNPLSFVLYGLDEIAEGLEQCRAAFLDFYDRVARRVGSAEARKMAGEAGSLSCAARAEVLHERALEGADGSRRIQRIVSDLRSLARTDDGGRLRPVEPGEVVRQAVSLTRHSLRHQAALEQEVASVPPVLGNEGRLVQVLVNLLVNAGQALAGQEDGRVLIRVAEADGFVGIEVSDNGPGIPEDVQKHLFEAFFTTKAPGEGSGLGLWICRDIAREHKGRLLLESRPGEGASFRLLVPVAEPEVFGAASQSSGLWAVGSGPARVLLVDDEPLVLAAMKRVLARQHRVKAVSSADEARQILETRPDRFDVVVCDLMMDGMTGMDLFRWMEEAVPRLAGRFVVVSGGAVTREARDFLASSRVPALAKPIAAGRLRRAVEALHTGAPWPDEKGAGGAR